jgi:hypothetical protein
VFVRVRDGKIRVLWEIVDVAAIKEQVEASTDGRPTSRGAGFAQGERACDHVNGRPV